MSRPMSTELSSRHELRVRFVETDLMGIVHHATYLAYFEAGRVDWLHKRGVRYLAWAAENVHLPVVEAHVRYRKVARFDEWLVVESTVSALTRVTVRFDYRVLRGEDVVCEGYTLLACVGEDLAPRRIPDNIATVFKSPESPASDWT
jgi:acyl-CoA thioester hydrolase